MSEKKKRREYGAGSVYQRKDGRWVGTVEAGWSATGARRRVTVSGKTEAVVKRRLRDKIADMEKGEVVTSPNITVKAWTDTYLPIHQATNSPNAHRITSGAVRNYIVPTIGHKRLRSLTPADVREVEAAVRTVGNKGSTAALVQRNLFAILRAAIAEGHVVPQRVLLAPSPKTSASDRKPLTIPEALAVLKQAAELPHGTRWAVALLGGMRQGECLGLTWDAIDFERERIVIEWQLQRLPYLDKTDRSKGFRMPNEYDARQIHKAWHLVRPKSRAGVRVVPILTPIVTALREWQQVAPENPAGLVWPTTRGTPASHQDDLEEWHALQGAASVGHPAGRYYHVHECRNVTATELKKLGANETVMTALMGHTSIRTTDIYTDVDDAARRAPLASLARLLELD